MTWPFTEDSGTGGRDERRNRNKIQETESPGLIECGLEIRGGVI